jgi:Lrp/AsnC family leucine-responsive transcriptional regulator
VHYIPGDDGYLVKARTAGTQDLGELIRKKITSIYGVISTKTSTVLQTFKETSRIPIR